jgi:hypothetical protein
MKKPDWLITLRNVETTNARAIHYVRVCVLIPHQQLLEFADRIFATFPSTTLKSHFTSTYATRNSLGSYLIKLI